MTWVGVSVSWHLPGAVVLSLVVSVPLGWLAYRFAPARGVVLTLVGLLYVIPSLALFALLPPLLGISFLSETNLVIALTIYAVATMTRFVGGLRCTTPSVPQIPMSVDVS